MNGLTSRVNGWITINVLNKNEFDETNKNLVDVVNFLEVKEMRFIAFIYT